MSEFLKKNKKREKAENDWVEKFRESFRRAISSIERHQEKKMLTSQVILLTIIGAFLVNLLTSSIYSLLINVDLENFILAINLDVLITLISSSLLVVIFFEIRRQLSKYSPTQPLLNLVVKPEDIKEFVTERSYNKINKYLDDGRLKDFRSFGKSFFESLESWFPYMFHPEITKKAIKEYEDVDKPSSSQYPTIIKEYDISKLSPSGVKINLEVKLVPDIVYSYGIDGDKTASYTFYIFFRFKILNPEHCYADNFLEAYYYVYAGRIVSHASYSINFAFSKLIPNLFVDKKKNKS